MASRQLLTACLEIRNFMMGSHAAQGLVVSPRDLARHSRSLHSPIRQPEAKHTYSYTPDHRCGPLGFLSLLRPRPASQAPAVLAQAAGQARTTLLQAASRLGFPRQSCWRLHCSPCCTSPDRLVLGSAGPAVSGAGFSHIPAGLLQSPAAGLCRCAQPEAPLKSDPLSCCRRQPWAAVCQAELMRTPSCVCPAQLPVQVSAAICMQAHAEALPCADPEKSSDGVMRLGNIVPDFEADSTQGESELLQLSGLCASVEQH